MKITHTIVACVALFVAMLAPLSTARAQGSLTPPPGAPAPAMKSLAQIEPRIPISTANFTINAPGSYYFTTNVTATNNQFGLIINSGNVTVDLNGFTLAGPSNVLTGIYFNNTFTNVTIRNGALRHWAYGADSYSVNGANVLFEHLTISDNATYGLFIQDAFTVRDCNFINNYIGIYCIGGQITGCNFRNSPQYGITAYNCLISGCRFERNGAGIQASTCTIRGCLLDSNGDGMDITESDAEDCTVQYNDSSDNGISATRSSVVNCVIKHNGTGIYMDESRAVNCEIDFNANGGVHCVGSTAGRSEIKDCRIYGNTTAGIFFDTGTGAATGNYIGGNTVYGISVAAGSAQITGNTCVSNLSTAILVASRRNVVDNNNILTPAGILGINVQGAPFTNNMIIRNTVTGDGANGISLGVIANNVSGPVISTTTAGVITGTSPFSNFSF